MSYELSFFDNFICRVYPEAVAAGRGVADAGQDSGRFRQEAEAVRSRMIAHVFGCAGPEEAAYYIRQHQHIMILLLDKICSFAPDPGTGPGNPADGRRGLLTCCCRSLEDLLVFIGTYFASYFSPDEKLPELHRASAGEELEAVIPEVRRALEQRGADPRLISLGLMPVADFLHPRTDEDITYRRLAWIRELVRQFLHLAAMPPVKDVNLELLQLFCYLNFNAMPVFNHCIELCKEELGSAPGARDRRQRLARLLRLVNQQAEKPGFTLFPARPSLKEMVRSWLYEEQDPTVMPGATQAGSLPAEEPRINTSVSVAQLAYLVCLFEQCGIFRPSAVFPYRQQDLHSAYPGSNNPVM